VIIGIPVYDDVDIFDVTGPFEMFDWAGFEIDLLAAEPGMKKFRSRGFAFSVTRGFAQARAYTPSGFPVASPTPSPASSTTLPSPISTSWWRRPAACA
jgi:cyclohexyl-isocyanide hydratase